MQLVDVSELPFESHNMLRDRLIAEHGRAPALFAALSMIVGLIRRLWERK